MASRASTRTTKFLAILFTAGLVFWGYHAYLHQTVKTMTQSMLTDHIASLKERLQWDHDNDSFVIRSLTTLIGQLQDQIQEQQPTPPAKTSGTEFAERRKRVQEVCSSSKVPGNVHGVYPDDHGVLYCFVPKAGCTFWKRVFRAVKTKSELFTSDQMNITQDSIFSISRNLVHSSNGKGVQYSPAKFPPEHYPMRFLVTRDPYSRLLSSYLDKVYLPDFWLTEIKPMLQKRKQQGDLPGKNSSIPGAPTTSKDFLRIHFDKMASTFSGDSSGKSVEVSTATESECGKYMTFAEFVAGGYHRAEPHWMPIHSICNPCLFNVTHVSHMETFNADARVILAQMGLEFILDDVDEDAQVDEELKTIVDYNFHRAFHDRLDKFYNSCVTTVELAYRLWTNFQWRGYIHPEVEYKVPDFRLEDSVIKDLKDQIWRARKLGLENRQLMKAAKNDFKHKAFATLSRDMLERLSQKYATDFKLFGYEEVRDKLYSALDHTR